MSLRTFVVFESNFSDDGTFSESGDLVRGPGFNIASELVKMLRTEGFKVSEPCERDYYGWEFTVSSVANFVIQGGKPWLLLSDASLLRKLFNPKHSLAHRQVLEKVNSWLHQDSRFHDIRWFTREDYEKNKDSDRAAWSSEP